MSQDKKYSVLDTALGSHISILQSKNPDWKFVSQFKKKLNWKSLMK